MTDRRSLDCKDAPGELEANVPAAICDAASVTTTDLPAARTYHPDTAWLNDLRSAFRSHLPPSLGLVSVFGLFALAGLRLVYHVYPSVVYSNLALDSTTLGLHSLRLCIESCIRENQHFLMTVTVRAFLTLVAVFVSIDLLDVLAPVLLRYFVLPRKEWTFRFLVILERTRRRKAIYLWMVFAGTTAAAAWWATSAFRNSEAAIDPVTFLRLLIIAACSFLFSASYLVDRSSGVYRFLIGIGAEPGAVVRVVVCRFFESVMLLSLGLFWVVIIDSFLIPSIFTSASSHAARIETAISSLEESAKGTAAAVPIAAVSSRLRNSQLTAGSRLLELEPYFSRVVAEAKQLMLSIIALAILAQTLLPLYSAELRFAAIAVAGLLLSSLVIPAWIGRLGTVAKLRTDSTAFMSFGLIAAFVAVAIIERLFKMIWFQGEVCGNCGAVANAADLYCPGCGAIRHQGEPALFVRSKTSATYHRNGCPVVRRISQRNRRQYATLASARADPGSRPCGYCRPDALSA